jgi:hypothetical protein
MRTLAFYSEHVVGRMSFDYVNVCDSNHDSKIQINWLRLGRCETAQEHDPLVFGYASFEQLFSPIRKSIVDFLTTALANKLVLELGSGGRVVARRKEASVGKRRKIADYVRR